MRPANLAARRALDQTNHPRWVRDALERERKARDRRTLADEARDDARRRDILTNKSPTRQRKAAKADELRAALRARGGRVKYGAQKRPSRLSE